MAKVTMPRASHLAVLIIEPDLSTREGAVVVSNNASRSSASGRLHLVKAEVVTAGFADTLAELEEEFEEMDDALAHFHSPYAWQDAVWWVPNEDGAVVEALRYAALDPQRNDACRKACAKLALRLTMKGDDE